MPSPVLVFLDLDDTLFQTHRKHAGGSVPATRATNPASVSYMTPAQALLFELLCESPRVSLIPVTARDQRQYRNTFLSYNPRVAQSVLYFGGQIQQQEQPDPEWESRTRAAYARLDVSMNELHAQAQARLGALQHAKLYNVDGYYLTLKVSADCPPSQQQDLFAAMRELPSPDYRIHHNGRALSLLPHCIDKRHAVTHLIERHRPQLTLGMGDSFSDWGFMQQCDFRVIPARAQLEQALAHLL